MKLDKIKAAIKDAQEVAKAKITFVESTEHRLSRIRKDAVKTLKQGLPLPITEEMIELGLQAEIEMLKFDYGMRHSLNKQLFSAPNTDEFFSRDI